MTKNLLISLIWLMAAGCTVANPLDSALIAYWAFDEDAGSTAYDSSGHGNHGTLIGDPIWTEGISGSAVEFDGVDDRADYPSLYTTSPSALTVCAWMKSPMSKRGMIIYHGENGEFGLEAGVEDLDKISFGVKLASGFWYSLPSSAVAPGSWHHVTGTWRKGDAIRIYIDGELSGEMSVTDHFLYDPDSWQPSIGSYNRSARFFDGAIDEVKVYSRTLSPGEIMREYHRGCLVGYWKFEEFSGETAYDSSGMGHHGTLLNGPGRVTSLPPLGQALQLDGYDDYVTIPRDAGLDISGAFTATAWVFPESFPYSASILMRWYDGTELDRGLALQIMGGTQVRFGVISGTYLFDIPYGFVLNTWYHVAGIWNGTVARVYVNGDLIAERPAEGTFTNQDVDLAIGVDPNPLAHVFDGKIDEVKLYNSALSAEEIRAEFRSAFICGDANGDRTVNISDAVYLIAYIFAGGSAPNPLLSGDANCDGSVNISDAVYLIAYIFAGGSAPCAECG